jgi:hypothetical protein
MNLQFNWYFNSSAGKRRHNIPGRAFFVGVYDGKTVGKKTNAIQLIIRYGLSACHAVNLAVYPPAALAGLVEGIL